MNEVLVFTPTFNEVENIKKWINLVFETNQGVDVLIVDDSSTDGTIEIIQKYQEEFPNLRLIVRNSKSGVGSAHMLAMKECYKGNYRLLVTLDADLSHNPLEIPKFVYRASNSNYIVGTRGRGGKTELRGVRLFLSKGANILCRIVLPTGLSEYTTAFRCFDRLSLQTLVENPPKNEGYSFFIEVTEQIYQSGLTMSEIPIVFADRKFGESKIPKLQVVKSSFTIIMLLLKRLIRFRKKRGTSDDQ